MPSQYKKTVLTSIKAKQAIVFLGNREKWRKSSSVKETGISSEWHFTGSHDMSSVHWLQNN